ncbi:uncharacterized protein [Henckelia pumila]|uniref:uncharacterized protein n=1 Tax=Henckelia pumila TaxID=405737 RepID=UPI003C6E47B7
MELTMNSSQTNHMISDGKKHGGGGCVIRGAFHILTSTLLSLLLPLSFLVLARLATVKYYLSISDNSLFLNKTPTTTLLLLVSVISASTLAQGLTGFLSQRRSSTRRRHLCAAWSFLCLLQLCVGVGVEGSVATGLDGSSFGQGKGLLCRVVFFLGLHETTRFWWRTVVKPVVDDTVFGVYVREEEGWLVKVAMGVGFGCLWWWRVRDEVEALAAVAEVKRELMMGIGVSDFVGWWLYYITVTIGMVGIVKGLIGVLMFLVCNNNNCKTREDCNKPTPNDEKV